MESYPQLTYKKAQTNQYYHSNDDNNFVFNLESGQVQFGNQFGNQHENQTSITIQSNQNRARRLHHQLMISIQQDITRQRILDIIQCNTRGSRAVSSFMQSAGFLHKTKRSAYKITKQFAPKPTTNILNIRSTSVYDIFPFIWQIIFENELISIDNLRKQLMENLSKFKEPNLQQIRATMNLCLQCLIGVDKIQIIDKIISKK